MIIRDNNIQKWLFDYFEGNLTPHEEIELNNFISQNPSYQSEFDAWQRSYPSKETKSKKNRVPAYAGASTLLVKTGIWARFNWKYAASIVMLIVGGSLIGYYNMPEETISNEVSALSKGGDYHLDDSNLNKEVTESFLSEKEFDTSLDTGSNTKLDANNKVNTVSNNSVNEFNTNFETTKIIKREIYAHQNTNSENNAEIISNIEKGVNNDVDETNQVIFTLNKEKESEFDKNKNRNKSKHNSSTSKIKKKSVVLFNRKIDKRIRFHSDKKQKKAKRYFYAGFKDLTGRGIGVRSKKSSQEKALTRKRKESDIDITITETGVGDKNNIEDPEKSRKKKSRKNSDLALMNLYDPIFIATNTHPLNVNAAMAGELGVPRIKSTFRLQNTNSSDYLTRSVSSFDMYIKELQAGVGLVISNDRLNNGVYNENKIEFIYAQKFEITRESSFTASLKYSGRQMKMDASKMDYNTQIEVERGVVYNTFSDVSSNVSSKSFRNDLGIATWYDGRYLYGGFQVDNLLRSKSYVYNETMNDSRLARSFSAQIGTDYRKSLYSDIVISPQINFNSQGGISELWVGSTVKYRSLVTGVGIGMINSTSFKGMLGIQNHAIRLMYGFDYSKSALESGMFASHELSLRILVGVKRNNWSRFKK